MPASDLFESLLTAKLGAPASPPPASGHCIRTVPFNPVAAHGSGTLHFGAEARRRGWALPAPDLDSPVASRRAIKPLSPAQRDALTALRRLGAALSEDFDAGQLKVAFRRLALQVHPDRHLDADSERRRWLGMRFAVLCEAYRTLSEPLPHP